MLNGMSDPQQPPVPPYASNAPQPPQPGHPAQPGYAGQPAPNAAPAPTANHYYQGGAPQAQHPQTQHPQTQQPYGQPAYPSAARGPSGANTPGRIGFVIGLVGLFLGLLSSVIIQIMIRTSDYQLISLISGAFAVITFLAALAALIFGIVGLRRPGAPHGLAGIATGLGGAGVVGAGFSFILTAFSAVLYF